MIGMGMNTYILVHSSLLGRQFIWLHSRTHCINRSMAFKACRFLHLHYTYLFVFLF